MRALYQGDALTDHTGAPLEIRVFADAPPEDVAMRHVSQRADFDQTADYQAVMDHWLHVVRAVPLGNDVGFWAHVWGVSHKRAEKRMGKAFVYAAGSMGDARRAAGEAAKTVAQDDKTVPVVEATSPDGAWTGLIVCTGSDALGRLEREGFTCEVVSGSRRKDGVRLKRVRVLEEQV